MEKKNKQLAFCVRARLETQKGKDYKPLSDITIKRLSPQRISQEQVLDKIVGAIAHR